MPYKLFILYILCNFDFRYLYGIVAGTAVTVAAAAVGIALAHLVISHCMANYLKVWVDSGLLRVL